MTNSRFLWTTTLLVLGVAITPYLIGWLLTPADYQFTWRSDINPNDPPVYFSYIEQGRAGHIVMADRFTSEPYAHTLFQPVWFVVGQVANITNLTTPAAFTVTRWLMIIPLIWTLWWAASWIFSDDWQRRAAVLLGSVGGGFGGLLAIIGNQTRITTDSPFDLWVTESFVGLSALTTTHFLLVTMGIIVTLVSVERAAEERRVRWTVVGGIAALIVTSTHPFHIITWLLIWLGLTGWRWASTKKFPRRYVFGWLAVLAMASPALLLFAWQRLFDPLVIDRATQNVTTSPTLISLSIGLGLFLIGSVIALSRRTSYRTTQQRFVAIWFLATVVAMYLPLIWQRRLGHALIVPTVWLSIPLLQVLWQRLARISWLPRRSVLLLSVVMVSLSTLVAIRLMVTGYLNEFSRGPERMYYLSPEYQSLISYFKEQARPDLAVLGTLTESAAIAGLAGQTVVVAHTVETVRYADKLAHLSTFYSSQNKDTQRTILDRYRVCYILLSPRTEAYGNSFRGDDWTDLRTAWSGPTMKLYQRSSCQ